MHLADFILRNMETILGEWEAFAMTLLPGAAGMTGCLNIGLHCLQVTVANARNTILGPVSFQPKYAGQRVARQGALMQRAAN